MKTSNEIKTEIMDAFKKHPMLASSDIKIDVVCGNVFLSGKVDSYYKKYAAGKLAKNTNGVKIVHPDLYVELPPNAKQTDAEIKNAILNALQILIPKTKIHISVYYGVVILTGEAKDDLQKNKIMNVVADMQGILNVWNFIKIKEKADNNKKSSDVTNSAVTERDIKHTDELIMA